MKRFWLVLLSLGLVVAFSASAFAVDVKFSGNYVAGGMYLNKISLTDAANTSGQSTAFYFQRMRLQTDFVVSPGLSVVTRANIMERIGGASRTTPGTALDTNSAATVAENQNIGFDRLYVEYASPIGTFGVGYQVDGAWGTAFNDDTNTAFKISHMYFFGKFMTILQTVKLAEGSRTAFNTTGTQADADMDKYVAAVVYTDKNFETGLLYAGIIDATTRTGTPPSKGKVHIFEPYVKAKIGPVAIQAELDYAFGKYEAEGAGGSDTKYNSLAGFIDAVATFGPVYVGGTFAYVSGDKADTTDTNEAYLTGGSDFNPTLILWNYDRSYWFGALNSPAGTFSGGMSNAFFYQVKGGVKPTDKLDISASVAFANADTTPANYVSKDYGYEIDVTGTYKLTNNLTYMLGAGYLITGDYFKGTNSNNKVTNDYLLINKLTLTF
ncbi:MAG: hypothetical protein AB2L12_04710 [Smithellaceae bacterium]